MKDIFSLGWTESMIGEQEDQEERLMDSGKFLKKIMLYFPMDVDVGWTWLTIHCLLKNQLHTILDHYIIGVLPICPFTYE